MRVETLAIPDVKLIWPKRIEDSRGWFMETWNRDRLREAGVDLDFRQENHSLSLAQGTVRGLHFQTPPKAQNKLVRVARGRIFDVAVDLRRASATYGRWVSAEISAEAGNQILVPAGFGHGFCSLEPDTEVIYLVDEGYSAQHDDAVLWNDPDLAIEWPVSAEDAVLSDKDRNGRPFAAFESPF